MQKKKAIENNTDTPLYNLLVFKKFRATIGGNVRVFVSGGAPFSRDSHEFMRICFDCPVIQGYGLTETCGGGTAQNLEHNDYSNAGAPILSCMLKLVDVAEMNYLTTDKQPKGEIYIKGENVSFGYLNDEKKTKEEFDSDGWFHTGDIGTFLDNGTLKIIDRKKNLVKMSHGEYVAIENLESIFGVLPFIFPNGIMVYGDSYKNSLVAIVLIKESYVKVWADENSIKYDDICNNKKLKETILNEFKNVAIKEKKKTFEYITNVHLTDVEWTPENGLLTSAMKLNRQSLLSKFKK